MDNNDISRKSVKRSKRSFGMLILVAVVLLPTLFAVVLFALISDGFILDSQRSLYEIRLYDTEGGLIGEDSSYIDEAEEGSIVALFSPITTSFAQTTELPDTLNKDKHFKALISYEGYTDEYTFYLSTTDDVGYCTVNGKKHYRLDDESVHSILSSKFAEIFYKTAVPPTLYSSSGDIIIPESVSWKYKVASGEYFKSGSYEISNENTEYGMVGSLSLYFSAEPDICIITVSQNGSELFSGSYYNMPVIYYDNNDTVSVIVEAEWALKEESNYHGRINYSFDARVTERPDFSIIGTTSEINSFFVLEATNIEDASKLRATVSPSINHAINFCGSGDSLVALVPVTKDMRGKEYTVSVSYGAANDTFKVSVPINPDKSVIVDSSATIERFNETQTIEVENDMELLRTQCAKETLTEKLYSGKFLDYTDMGATRYAKFDDFFRVASLNYYRTVGTEYRFENGIGIGVPVLNNGKVIRTGYNARLGNYVIVSHGAGLATWYAHLSAIDVEEGQYVAKGEIVGKTGTSGLSGEDNVAIIATIADQYIDVAYLIGKEF